MIRETLIKVTSEYLSQKRKSTKGNELFKWITHEIPNIFYKVFDKNKLIDFHIKASAGEGNWKHVPWIAILHKKN